jgi:uncharacterized protein YndB with AHSA1/START domain
MLHRVRHVSVGIERPPDEVYAFVSDPANLPRWATAFCLSVRRSGDEWIVETPEAPMRVVANGSGSEVLAALVQRDLETLKDVVERRR